MGPLFLSNLSSNRHQGFPQKRFRLGTPEKKSSELIFLSHGLAMRLPARITMPRSTSFTNFPNPANNDKISLMTRIVSESSEFAVVLR
jgi:hypothetical protein